jgi:cyanophycinase
MKLRILAFLSAVATLLGVGGWATPGTVAARADYDYYVVGSSRNVFTSTSGGTVLMGGGPDVDDAFRWMIGKSGGGDFVVIRTSGSDGYNSYIDGLGRVNSVETIVFRNRRASNSAFAIDKIRNAEALFIAGGDQSEYIRFWRGTPVETAIRELIARGVPVGGTSAGMAILGEFVYSAAQGSITSSEALANPFDSFLTLERSFVPSLALGGVITDTHFVPRDRMGRLTTFLARLAQDGFTSDPKGIGVDEDVAVLIEPDGRASIAGGGDVYFLRTPGLPERCSPGVPLTFRNISVYRATSSATFHLPSWSGSGGTAYSVSVERGVVSSSKRGIY